MPITPHVESHFTAGETVRDIVIGMSDGLTVPFALAAGLTGAIAQSSIIVTAGIAEIAAGSIAMGLGGYLAAKTDVEHYHSEREREVRETKELPEKEIEEVQEIFKGYGLEGEQLNAVVHAISKDNRKWVDFMMRFELGIEEPDPKRASHSAITIALSYIVGGLIPLVPYFFVEHAPSALRLSIALTLIALFVFGVVKGRFTGLRPLRSGLQTVIIGGIAAAVAFMIARLIS